MLTAGRIRHAADILRQGGLVAYPTEGVYGLGCRPDLPGPIERLCELKQRPLNAGLILIAADPQQLARFIDPEPVESERLEMTQPHPVTWIVTAGPLSSPWVTGGRATVAVRITDHPLAAALCRAVDMPLISTSANRRGRPPARNALQVRRWFAGELDLVVTGATGNLSGPTEIRMASSGDVLRPSI